MPERQPGKLLRLHICESDRHDGKPLYEAIVEKCRELKIAGATVFRGLEGFGESAEIHRGHVLTHDFPILIAIVDTAENIGRALPAIENMVTDGLIAISDVEMLRLERPAASETQSPQMQSPREKPPDPAR